MGINQHSLSHIRWLGGSPCSGKSTVSTLLDGRFDLSLYQVDHALRAQMGRILAERHPALSAWMAASCDGRWLKPVDELLADAIACYTDHFSLILEDLSATSSERVTLAEGTALLPPLVAELGIRADHALWLVPTPTFQRNHYRRRPWVKEMLAMCSDPERAFDNWMERDSRFARWAADQTEGHGYAVVWVDGDRDIEANAILVAEHFGLDSQC